MKSIKDFKLNEIDLKNVKGGRALNTSISKTFDLNTLTVTPSGNADDGDDNAWDV